MNLFEAGAVAPDRIADLTLELTRPWPEVLQRRGVGERPAADVWSPLEYAAHVRDVCVVFDGRVHQLLVQDPAEFENWDQDKAAVDGRYDELDPTTVSGELVAAAAAVSASFARVPDDAWSRRGIRSNGSHFTLLTLGQYMLHDLAHHLVDVDAPTGATGATG